MKNLLLVAFCITLLSTMAMGQVGNSISPQVTRYTFWSTPEKAAQRGMATPDEIMEKSYNVSAKGERPLWEVGELLDTEPLGDVARRFRNEHVAVKKAEVIFENF